MEQQMTMNKKNSYVEILEILKYMDKIYVDKIPKELIKFLRRIRPIIIALNLTVL